MMTDAATPEHRIGELEDVVEEKERRIHELKAELRGWPDATIPACLSGRG
jgi:hypothetical protein